MKRDYNNNTLALIQIYSWLKDIRRHFFLIGNLSISASSKTNMDGCNNSAAFTKVGLIVNRKRDNSSCYELTTRAATRREMKVASQLVLGDVKLRASFYKHFRKQAVGLLQLVFAWSTVPCQIMAT